MAIESREAFHERGNFIPDLDLKVCRRGSYES